MSPDEPAGEAITDWLHGWEGRPSRNGPAFVVTIPGAPRFIGQVSFTDRGQGVVEMEYGIAPRWRRRGLATRAARWALSLPDVTAVELRIAQQNTASQHVAVNAGFAAAGTVTQFVPQHREHLRGPGHGLIRWLARSGQLDELRERAESDDYARDWLAVALRRRYDPHGR